MTVLLEKSADNWSGLTMTVCVGVCVCIHSILTVFRQMECVCTDDLIKIVAD